MKMSESSNSARDLSHIDESGKARMVDVGSKDVTERVASAGCEIHMQQSTLDLIRSGGFDKGDVLGVARLAGVMAGKKTSDLIPLCHPLALNQITIDFGDVETGIGLTVTSTARTSGKTGVEMEALTGVMAGLLCVWDLVKPLEKDETGQYPETRIHNVEVVEKLKGEG